MKVKIFTHNDLDGVACAFLADMAFEEVDVEYCDYTNIDSKVMDFISSGEFNNYTHVYITDISLNKQTAEIIEHTQPKTFVEGFTLKNKFTLVDHHQTAEWMTDYSWCIVFQEDYCGKKICGASLFLSLLKEEDYLDPNGIESISSIYKDHDKAKSIDDFIETVRQYDTYEWKSNNNREAKMWNDFLKILGKDNFRQELFNKLSSEGTIVLGPKDKDILQIEQDRIDRYIEEKGKSISRINIKGYEAGVVFAENYVSELGNKLAETNTDLDFIVIVNMNTEKPVVNYRAVKDSVNLGKEIAEPQGGGGHPKSAGSPIPKEIRDNLIAQIFKEGS